MIRDLIKKGKYAAKISKCNQETLIIQGDSPLDIRKVHSYPSCARTLRGTGGDVVYMEEAAFMSLDVFSGSATSVRDGNNRPDCYFHTIRWS